MTWPSWTRQTKRHHDVRSANAEAPSFSLHVRHMTELTVSVMIKHAVTCGLSSHSARSVASMVAWLVSIDGVDEI